MGRPRSLLLLLLLGAASLQGAAAATVTGALTDVTLQPLSPRLYFTPKSTPQALGTNTVLDVVKTVTASTNGTFSLSLVGGLYDVGFGPFSKTIRILVPPNDTNTYDFNTCAALATNLGTFSFTNVLQTAVAQGTNVVLVTNATTGVVTIHATGTGAATDLTFTNLYEAGLNSNPSNYAHADDLPSTNGFIVSQEATNAALGVVTYSNLPAGNLTGALPAIDGSALIGVTSTAVSTNPLSSRTLYGDQLKLDIPTFDGGTATIHPAVLEFPTNWPDANGFRYWMAHTPFPPEARENPSIVASHDGVNWVTPPGLTNPISDFVEMDGGTPKCNVQADTELAWVAGNRLVCYWMGVGSGSGSNFLFCKFSTDGVTWGPRHTVFGITNLYWQGWTLNGPRVLPTTNANQMCLWFNNWTVTNSLLSFKLGDGTGTNWGDTVDCTGLVPATQNAHAQTNLWHFDVWQDSTGTKFWLLGCEKGAEKRLKLYSSSNRTNWSVVTTNLLLPSGLPVMQYSWYTPSVVPVSMVPHVVDIYFSGLSTGEAEKTNNIHTGIALFKNVVIDSGTTLYLPTTNSPSAGMIPYASSVATAYWSTPPTSVSASDSTNAALGVVTYSNLPAAHLTGALPAIDGSALTGVLAGTPLTNWWHVTAKDVLAEQSSTVIDRLDAYRINWPAYNAGTTVGGAKFWASRGVILCANTNYSDKFYTEAPLSATQNKTNIVIIQKYYTTNTTLLSAACAIEYVSNDNASTRWQGGLLVNNKTNTTATNPYLFSVTNAFSLPPQCTNGMWSLMFGRAAAGDGGVIPTNSVWWAGVDAYFY